MPTRLFLDASVVQERAEGRDERAEGRDESPSLSMPQMRIDGSSLCLAGVYWCWTGEPRLGWWVGARCGRCGVVGGIAVRLGVLVAHADRTAAERESYMPHLY